MCRMVPRKPPCQFLVGLQRPCGAVLNRLVRSGALGELSFVSRTRPIDRNIQQFREVDIRRRKRNADHALCHRFDRGNLGQSVVIRRTFVFQHSLETFGNITCRQLRTRPELDALFYRKAERGSIARIVLAQLVFECKIVFISKGPRKAPPRSMLLTSVPSMTGLSVVPERYHARPKYASDTSTLSTGAPSPSFPCPNGNVQPLSTTKAAIVSASARFSNFSLY